MKPSKSVINMPQNSTLLNNELTLDILKLAKTLIKFDVLTIIN